MNRNVAASFSLSVLIVLFFAVILYQPDRPLPARDTAKTPVAPVASRAPSDPPATETSNYSLQAAESPKPAIVAARDGNERRKSLANPIPLPPTRNLAAQAHTETKRSATVTRPVSRRVARDSKPIEPRNSLTKAKAGESLADVAIRVYGTDLETKRLWLANRDLLESVNAPLNEGTLLRTP